MEPLADDGEADRLEKPDHEARHGRGDDRLAEHQVSPQVPDACGDLGPAVLLDGDGSLLLDVHEAEGAGGDEERRRVHDGDRATPEGGEQSGSGQRPEQPQALAHRLKEAVGVDEEVTVEHRDEEARLCGTEERIHGAVEEGDQPDEPNLAAAVDEQQAENDEGAAEVRPNENGTPPQAVDDEPGERR